MPGTYLVRYAAAPNYNAGADVTLTIAPYSGGGVPTAYAITINAAAGGVISADRMSAYPGETVTLTVTTNTGYVLSSIIATASLPSVTAKRRAVRIVFEARRIVVNIQPVRTIDLPCIVNGDNVETLIYKDSLE